MTEQNDSLNIEADDNGVVFEYDANGYGVRAKHLASGLQEYSNTHTDVEANKFIAFGKLLDTIGIRENTEQILALPTPTDVDTVYNANTGVNGSSEVDVPAQEANVSAASDTSGAVAASNDDSVPNVTNEDGVSGDISVSPNSDDPDAAGKGVNTDSDTQGQGGNEDASGVIPGVTAPVVQPDTVQTATEESSNGNVQEGSVNDSPSVTQPAQAGEQGDFATNQTEPTEVDAPAETIGAPEGESTPAETSTVGAATTDGEETVTFTADTK